MTLEEIKAMFQPGQQWRAENTYMTQANGIRTVGRIHTTQMTWTWPDGRVGYMPFPPASRILEARDGYLRFKLFSDHEVQYRKPGAIDAVLTLERVRVETAR
jgi:hypothetical protein